MGISLAGLAASARPDFIDVYRIALINEPWKWRLRDSERNLVQSRKFPSLKVCIYSSGALVTKLDETTLLTSEWIS